MAKAVSVPEEKLWGVWPSGVDLEQFAPGQVARRWPLTSEPVHLIYVGLLNHERNLMALCQAVEDAHTEGMAFTLSLVGKGTEQEALQEFARQTETRVRVLAPVPHKEIPQLLAQAHIGVLPFPDGEEFQVSSPVKLFEYMASGLPVLATRIACHTDVLADGDYTFWAEEAGSEGLLAALRLAWDARATLPQMGCRSAGAAQAWTWQESAGKLRDAMEHGTRCASHRERI
jgi:glycosyltransferase involved in cell wall biosynthesis